MHKTNPLLVGRCRDLRRRGFTLREISKLIKLPQTTAYDHISDIPSSLELKERIRIKQAKNTQRLIEFNIKERKGRCVYGRVVLKPKGWTPELIFLASHFMFDGEIQTHSCIYHNRNKALINGVEFLMKRVFSLRPYHWVNKETGVHRISYHYVELADYMREKAEELKKYIHDASLSEKKIFLKAFFNDEGSAYFRKKQKRRAIRGYQHNLAILKLVQKLLIDFDINSKIDEKYKEIVISKKPNLIKFSDNINFSKGVYINPNRKNSIWKKKLEKREILNRIINSYKK